MNIQLREMTKADIEYVQANPYQESVKTYPPLPCVTNSYTCVFDDEIVAVGGLRIYWKGVGQVWLILTKQARKEGIFGLIALNAISRKVEDLIVEHDIVRCEAECRADFPQAINLIKALGFTFECVKRKYYPDGSNMNTYARIRE